MASSLSPQVTVATGGTGPFDVFVLGSQDQGVYRQSLSQVGSGTQWVPSQTTWEPHGGPFASAPVAISWGANRLDIFAQTAVSDSPPAPLYGYYHQAWDGAGWSPSRTDWENHGHYFKGPPAVASWGSGRLDIFGQGYDDALYWQAWDGANWEPGPSMVDWKYHGGTLLGSPSAVSWGPNRIDVFVEGWDGNYYHQAWDGANWQPSETGWEDHGSPPGVRFMSPPAVVSWGSGRLDIFGLGDDGHYYHQAWENGWQPSRTTWEDHGNDGTGPFVGPPVVTSWGANELDIFGVGADGAGYHQRWDGGWIPSQFTYEYHGGTFASTPAAISWSANQYDVFGPSSADGALNRQTWTGSGSDPWSPSETTYEFHGGKIGGSLQQ